MLVINLHVLLVKIVNQPAMCAFSFCVRIASHYDISAKANLTDVILYLRGNRHLRIPDSWYATVNVAIDILLSFRKS